MTGDGAGEAQQPLIARLWRFGGFVTVGASVTVLVIAIRGALMLLAPFELAVALAHLGGTVIAYTLNRLFVFKGLGGGVVRAYLRYLVVNLGSLGVTVLVSSVLYRAVLGRIALPHVDFIAHAAGLAVALVPTYLAHAAFSFRKAA